MIRPRSTAAVLAVAGAGLAAALGACGGDEGSASTATRVETTTAPGQLTETSTTTGGLLHQTVTRPLPDLYASPRSAARGFARDALGITAPAGYVVRRSHRDPRFARVTWYDPQAAVAVWVRRFGGKWIGLVGTTAASYAPGGLGIPSDIDAPL